MNKELEIAIAEVMALSSDEFYAKFPIFNVVKFVKTFDDFCAFTKFIDEKVMPIMLEREDDFSNSFDFTFGCFSDKINSSDEYGNIDKLSSEYTHWTILAECLCSALITSG